MTEGTFQTKNKLILILEVEMLEGGFSKPLLFTKGLVKNSFYSFVVWLIVNYSQVNSFIYCFSPIVYIKKNWNLINDLS